MSRSPAHHVVIRQDLRQVASLPVRPPATTVAPGTDVGPAVPTCRCGQQLEESWAYCPACSRSTAPPAPRPPSRAEQLDAAMRLQRATPPPPDPTTEQRLVAALIRGGRPALAEVDGLDPAHFGDEGLGYALTALRHLAASRGSLRAEIVSMVAGRIAEAAATPAPSGPWTPKAVAWPPNQHDLERWAKEVTAAEAVQVARDLGAQVRSAGTARLAEQDQFWQRVENEARLRAREGQLPCPHCASWQVIVEDLDGFRQRERCLRCRASWPARAREQLEEV